MARFTCALFVLACSGPAGTDAGTDAAPLTCGSDSECSDDLFCNGEEECEPADPSADDRGCVPASAPPCMEACDEAAGACGACEDMADADGDGARSSACGGDDCDDNDADRSPDLPEICDASDVDEDCDPATIGDRDEDDDGRIDVECCNGTRCGDDCDDARANVNPLASEVCDGFDNDCDELVDDGVTIETWPDADDDGYGDEAAVSQLGCTIPTGRVERAGDCDDTDGTVNPTQQERCGGADEDCDGETDEPESAVWCESTRPGARGECIAGECVVTGCRGGRFDCDGDNDSCEIDLCGDAGNCDGCGARCFGTAPACFGGVCTERAEAYRTSTLRDADTGAPIAGATITYVGTCTTRTFVTDMNGEHPVWIEADWARIEAAGYPTHLQPLNPSSEADAFGPIVSQARFDAWLADPDLALTPRTDRAIIVADHVLGAGWRTVITSARVGDRRGAEGDDLLPGWTGVREVLFNVVPGRAFVGGSVSESGCTENCGPRYDVLLEPGMVTYTRGFGCQAFCS